MATKSDQPPLIVVVGETAAGKSALAMDLARRFDGEIICADSWTVRREVNIGTAKPSLEEQRQIRHHLLDLVEPCGDFTAAVFKRLANSAIADIAARRRLPIMVGGTGLYIDAVLFDYSFLPAADRQQRQRLNTLDIADLLAIIKADGLTLEGIDIRNKRRLVRLIESGGQRPTSGRLRDNTLIIGVSLPKESIRQRVTARVDQMLSQGLEREVKELADKYGWGCESLKGIGYREWRPYFEGVQSLDETGTRIIRATMDLAKRQKTWFKRNKKINWIWKTEEAVDVVTTFLNK
jgi:tRNA dimethylallyltransferase